MLWWRVFSDCLLLKTCFGGESCYGCQNDCLLLKTCFRGFVLPVLDSCASVWCSAATGTCIQWYQSFNWGFSGTSAHVIYAPLRRRTSQLHMTFIPHTASLWNNLVTLQSMVWDWRVLRVETMLLCWSELLLTFCLLLFSLPLLSFYGLVLWG